MVQIGTTGELGILIAGISIGVGATVKAIKWITEIIEARKGTGKKYDSTIVDDVMKRTTPSLTRIEHESICRGVQVEYDKGIQMLREDIKELGQKRSEEVRLIFEEMKSNQTETRNLFLEQGQRIASVETSISNMDKRMDKMEKKVDNGR